MPHQAFHRQWSRRDAAAITAAMERCGVADLRYRDVGSLSGGQRQRAWIAMALAQDTPYLFLDEPTTFLDIGYQVEVLDLVSRLNRDEGRTVVMILHDLNLAARYSDHVVAMKDGRIVTSGPPSAVVTRDTVRDVFAVDSHLQSDARTGRPLLITGRDERNGTTAPSAETLTLSATAAG
ncbi:MAG: ABC transporter ATP-binding protein [Acidimicrobiia bacterium]